jgi:hypothetical protein
MEQALFPDFAGFDWDAGNIDKNRLKHGVEGYECEQVFFNEPIMILPDSPHSANELRFAAFGVTDAGRLLAVVFTVRKSLVRVISARDMNRREREYYIRHG